MTHQAFALSNGTDEIPATFTEALGIINWHRSHTHCPRCGAETIPEMGGWVRRCGSRACPG